MGQEVRRVVLNWEHPKDERGKYIPLLGGSFSKRLKEWEEGNEQWEKGLRISWNDESTWILKEDNKLGMAYEDWDGKKPKIGDYMPDWSENEKTHIQMYENTSEGTPISPIFNNAEDLAKWLVDNGVSSFGRYGRYTTTYEEWLATINISNLDKTNLDSK